MTLFMKVPDWKLCSIEYFDTNVNVIESLTGWLLGKTFHTFNSNLSDETRKLNSLVVISLRKH